MNHTPLVVERRHRLRVLLSSPVFSRGQSPSKGPSVTEKAPTAIEALKAARETIPIGTMIDQESLELELKSFLMHVSQKSCTKLEGKRTKSGESEEMMRFKSLRPDSEIYTNIFFFF